MYMYVYIVVYRNSRIFNLNCLVWKLIIVSIEHVSCVWKLDEWKFHVHVQRWNIPELWYTYHTCGRFIGLLTLCDIVYHSFDRLYDIYERCQEVTRIPDHFAILLSKAGSFDGLGYR